MTRFVFFLIVAFSVLDPGFAIAATVYSSFADAMAACEADSAADNASYCQPEWGRTSTCTVQNNGAAVSGNNAGITWTCVYHTGQYLFPAPNCSSGAITSSSGAGFQFGAYKRTGDSVCDPNYCQGTYTEDSSTAVDVCITVNPLENSVKDTFGTGTICFEHGTITQNGSVCQSSGGGEQSQPDDPNNPSHCQRPQGNSQVPAGEAVCFKPPNDFCSGASCIPVMGESGGGGGNDGGTESSDPKRPSGSAPGGGCEADSTQALCDGNPPPNPPPPPTGPGSNCHGSTANWTVNGWPDQTTDYQNCPPPTSSCPAGTTMVNGECVSGCPDGQAMVNGQCGQQCPVGQTLQNGQCNYVCPPGQSLSGGQCVSNNSCPAGTTAQNGVCVGQCPSGQVNDGSGCHSACGAGTSWSNGQCVASCPSGSSLNSSTGVCQPSSCPSGQVLSNGQCTTQCQGNQVQQGTQCIDKGTANGGTDCTNPPQCNGDQIQCNIDYQAWAARCSAGKASTGDLSKLYTASTDTVGSVMGKYQDQFKSSPFVTAANNFLTVNPTGTCPQLSIPAADFMGTNIWAGLNPNLLCEGTLLNVMDLAGYVVLALAAFQAFRIALY